ncbi:MAG: hypothetical protein EXR98_05975 [Gemmataceae bacterium]|nr:hypothetical protein [Gemmataceae bacterium]
MAFVVQCPFCKFRATAPDRALGAAERCPKCASAFTVAPLDDSRLPESGPAEPGAEANAEPVESAAIEAAIREAAAAVKPPPAIEPPADALRSPTSKRSNLSRLGGALAIFLSGLALAAGTVALLHPLVRVLIAMALPRSVASQELGAQSGLGQARPAILHCAISPL